jgi:hypothetical protein
LAFSVDERNFFTFYFPLFTFFCIFAAGNGNRGPTEGSDARESGENPEQYLLL